MKGVHAKSSFIDPGWLFDARTGVNLLVYGAAVTSRQTLTQALLADLVGEELFDAAFSLYYFTGFLSIPFWTVITGGIMTKFGFGPNFSRDLDFLSSCHEPSGVTAHACKRPQPGQSVNLFGSKEPLILNVTKECFSCLM